MLRNSSFWHSEIYGFLMVLSISEAKLLTTIRNIEIPKEFLVSEVLKNHLILVQYSTFHPSLTGGS